ncbi:MAG: hypothetical protein ACR2GV_06975 [Gaiellaceae bacterium]
MQRLLLVALVAVAVLSGCGDDDETTPTETMTVKAYFLRDGQVSPVTREVEETGDDLTAAVNALRLGPTELEATLGLTTALPETQDTELPRLALAQLVYTLTQFSSTDSAEIDGVNYTRADFEDPHARDSRRVAALVRGGDEPAPRDWHGQHVRGELPVRADRHRRPNHR